MPCEGARRGVREVAGRWSDARTPEDRTGSVAVRVCVLRSQRLDTPCGCFGKPSAADCFARTSSGRLCLIGRHDTARKRWHGGVLFVRCIVVLSRWLAANNSFQSLTFERVVAHAQPCCVWVMCGLTLCGLTLSEESEDSEVLRGVGKFVVLCFQCLHFCLVEQ